MISNNYYKIRSFIDSNSKKLREKIGTDILKDVFGETCKRNKQFLIDLYMNNKSILDFNEAVESNFFKRIRNT